MMPTLLVATRKGLFTIDDLWGPPIIVNRWFAGGSVTAALRDSRDAALYIAMGGRHASACLHRSSDRGKSWTEISVPADGIVVSLEAGHADEPGALWCGMSSGDLFRSADRGATWTHNTALRGCIPQGCDADVDGHARGIHSIVTDPRSPDRLGVGVSNGYWYTNDGGSRWALGEGLPGGGATDLSDRLPMSGSQRVARCVGAPDVLWMQHARGVFRSDDAGQTWSDVGPNAARSAFGYAVAAHPSDPQVAWFVPCESSPARATAATRMAASRTRDGGDSFDLLTAGLPEEHAYHHVNRRGIDVSADGRRLVMGSTTGSLWVSHDSGDRWRLVTANLPPIHAVRFIA